MSNARGMTFSEVLKPRHAPCEKCGDHCSSQLEFMDENGGKPWKLCSGCDPQLNPLTGKRKRERPFKMLWALYDAAGELFDVYTSKEEAEQDAVGPRFRPKHTIRTYKLLLRREERP